MNNDPRTISRDPECVCTPDNPSAYCPYHGSEVARLRHEGKDPREAFDHATNEEQADE